MSRTAATMTITPAMIHAHDGISGSRRSGWAGAGAAAVVAAGVAPAVVEPGAPAACAVNPNRPETGCPSSAVTRHYTV